MHRFFAAEDGLHGDVVTLCEEDARHAARVLRLRAGDRVQIFCAGEAYLAELTDAPQARLLEKLPSPEPTVSVTLYQGLPKGDKMDWIVQKCTEAGVRRIVPVEMARCVAALREGGEKKLTRWNRIAREAAKQAFRPLPPEVCPPLPMAALPQALRAHALALVPWEEARRGALREIVTPATTDVALVIGPEGGMDESEVKALLEAGARTVTLGPRVLRTETAGLAALIAVMTLTGNLE